MNTEELLLALTGTKEERAALDAIELVVTLRKPDEVEELLRANAELRAQNEKLKSQLDIRNDDAKELLSAYTRLNSAKKVLRKNGISTAFLDF